MDDTEVLYLYKRLYSDGYTEFTCLQTLANAEYSAADIRELSRMIINHATETNKNYGMRVNISFDPPAGIEFPGAGQDPHRLLRLSGDEQDELWRVITRK